MKYYVEEHSRTYKRLVAEGKSSWDELYGRESFEDAAVRPMIAVALPHMVFQSDSPRALEYGCGTGPGACFLAEHGFRVDGVDLDPRAIEIARREAAKRGLQVGYSVGDLLEMESTGQIYDLVVDSFCLQSIVLDRDRARLFDLVHQWIDKVGYYLIATAGFRASRHYGAARFEPETGLVYRPLPGRATPYEDAVQFAGRWYLPDRRHLTADQLENELIRAGFRVKWHQCDETSGDLVFLCRSQSQGRGHPTTT